MNEFKECKCKDFFWELKEAIPPNAPKEGGKEVYLHGYVNSNHGEKNKTRRSRSGFFILFYTVLIQWFSKKQATIETSMFGVEFFAMKIVTKTIQGISYKLKMMGVPIYGPSYIYGDNMLVIHNTQLPDSTLKKKSNYIFYHAVHEYVVMGDSLTGHVGTNENCADLDTKILYGGKCRFHVSNLLYNIYDNM